MASQEFDYDVFISYAKEDREWAAKVNTLLGKRRVFLDYQSIRTGDDWEKTIRAGLEKSQHLLVLWSEHAQQSEWVTLETVTFKKAAPAGVGGNRRLLQLNLKGASKILASYQALNVDAIQKSYPNLPITKEVWDSVALNLAAGLDADREPMAVPVVVLSLTSERVARFDAETWAKIEAIFGVDREALSGSYDKDRFEWKPFGDKRTVSSLLEDIRQQVQASLPKRRLEWNYPSETFWVDANGMREFVNNSLSGAEAALVVLDPIALYDLEVNKRLQAVGKVLSDSAAIVVLPPFALSPQLVGLRQVVDDQGVPFFDDYFRPAIPPGAPFKAQLCWNAADIDEVRRLFLQAAGSPKSRQAGPGSPYVQHGQP